MARSLLHFSDVTYTHPGAIAPVFEGLTFAVPAGWTGVVGANGAGKTTCLQLATGHLAPDSGHVAGAGGFVCVQRTDAPPEGLEALLAGEDAEAWVWRLRLGLDPAWGSRWSSLSHGERKRLQLAVALWRNPPLLAVDEPTNHVDQATAEVVRQGLAAYRGLGLLVSHDRALLDALCGQCLFLEGGAGVLRPGSWSEGQAQASREQLARSRERQILDREVRALQAECQQRREHAAKAERARSKRGLAPKDHDGKARVDLARLMDGTQGAGIRQLQGRMAQAEARQREVVVRRSFALGVSLAARPAPRSLLLSHPGGRIALGPERHLVLPALVVRPGERIGISGPNGSGKSSLVRALLAGATLPPGAVACLPQEVEAGMSRVLLEAVHGLPPDRLGALMALVRRLGSDPARLLQSRTPSPGELRKLLLAQALLQAPCLVVLDEPTNHLDLPSITCLEEALEAYGGALLLVSHDGRFLDRLTRRRWVLETVTNGNPVLRDT
jgi:ATPase subunit of ABC transporter with duplicated ATPase domains